VDGVVLATGNRVYAAGQTTATQKGIYIVNTAGAWTRSVDMAAGSTATNAYAFCYNGTLYTHTGWTCTSGTTVGTDALTITQVYVGADILQNAPQAANGNNGIQLGPGTDLVTKTAATHPFTTYVYPTTLVYQLNGDVNTATRYLWQGVQTSGDTTEVFYRFQQKSVVQGMSVTARTAPGGTHTVTVTVNKATPDPTTGAPSTAGVPTLMTAQLVDSGSTGNIAFNYGTSVDFAQGDFLSVSITGSAGSTAADIVVEIDAF
jgi:hypothetical protein